MTKIKTYDDFVNEADSREPTLSKLKKELKQMETSAQFFRNAHQQTENDKQNVKFYEDLADELRERIRQKEATGKKNEAVHEAKTEFDSEAFIAAVEDEMSWNMCRVTALSPDEVKDITDARPVPNTIPFLYQCMAGASVIPELKKCIADAFPGLAVKISRGFDTSRRADTHDYVIQVKP